MRRKILSTTILVLGLVAMATIAAAQESQVIHYQGMLTGPDGNPLRTDIYDVNFSIWDQPTGGVEPQWSEMQIVEVTNGLFDVFLGSDIPLSADVFTHDEGESDLRFLEIQVQDDDPMTPRTQIAKTPNSFVSSRVLGDVVTGPGSLKLMEPADDKVGFDVFTGAEGNSIKLMDPGDDEFPAMQMMSDDVSNGMVIFWTEPIDNEAIPVISMDADGLNNSINFRMAHPPEGPDVIPSLEMTAYTSGTSFKMMDPGDDKVGFDVFIGGEGNSIKLMDPGDDGVSVAEITADAAQTSFKMMDPVDDKVGFDVFTGGEGNSIKLMDPGDDGNSLIEMNGGIGGDASIIMFNPQPEPPAVVMEMSSSPSLGGSIKMFNPQPEPPAEPLLEMNTTQFGANFAMAAPQAGGLRNEITDPMFEVNVDAEGAGLNMEDEIGKYMGFDPTPFYDGGLLKMFDPVTDNTMVSLGSDGAIQARKATFGSSSNDGSYNLVVGMGGQASGDYNFVGGYQAQSDYNNCFLWADYSTYQPLASSAANQFLVRSSGGITFYSSGNMLYGVTLGPGEYSWSSIVPPGPELNTRPVDGEEILSKIERLPVKYYSHKDQEGGVEHIGPMPEDFNSLFGLGQDDERISMLDPSGVALAGVQALLDKIERLEARIAELEAKRR